MARMTGSRATLGVVSIMVAEPATTVALSGLAYVGAAPSKPATTRTVGSIARQPDRAVDHRNQARAFTACAPGLATSDMSTIGLMADGADLNGEVPLKFAPKGAGLGS